jgi:altronate hydrolase
MNRVICLHADDNVVIACAALLADTAVAKEVVTRARIPAGHKVAVRPIARGEPVRRYNQVIGVAPNSNSPGNR